MTDAMDGLGGIGRAGADAGVEMIDDAGQRPAPTGIADIGDVIPLAAQPPSKQRGLHLMAAKAVEKDDGLGVGQHGGMGVMLS
jgi:hypothetical protein